MREILLLISLLLVGCGRAEYVKVLKLNPMFKGMGQDSRVSKYVDLFEQESGNSVIGNPIVFTKGQMGNDVGRCYTYKGFTYWEIELDIDVWNSLDDMQRQVLVFHELAHCVLKKDHNNEIFEFGQVNCPNSILLHRAFSRFEVYNCLIPLYNDYMRELFN